MNFTAKAIAARVAAEQVIREKYRAMLNDKDSITCIHCSGDMNKTMTCSNRGLCVSIEEFKAARGVK